MAASGGLTKQYNGLPLWSWLALGGAATAGVYMFVRGYRSSKAASKTPASSQTLATPGTASGLQLLQPILVNTSAPQAQPSSTTTGTGTTNPGVPPSSTPLLDQIRQFLSPLGLEYANANPGLFETELQHYWGAQNLSGVPSSILGLFNSQGQAILGGLGVGQAAPTPPPAGVPVPSGAGWAPNGTRITTASSPDLSNVLAARAPELRPWNA